MCWAALTISGSSTVITCIEVADFDGKVYCPQNSVNTGTMDVFVDFDSSAVEQLLQYTP